MVVTSPLSALLDPLVMTATTGLGVIANTAMNAFVYNATSSMMNPNDDMDEFTSSIAKEMKAFMDKVSILQNNGNSAGAEVTPLPSSKEQFISFAEKYSLKVDNFKEMIRPVADAWDKIQTVTGVVDPRKPFQINMVELEQRALDHPSIAADVRTLTEGLRRFGPYFSERASRFKHAVERTRLGVTDAARDQHTVEAVKIEADKVERDTHMIPINAKFELVASYVDSDEVWIYDRPSAFSEQISTNSPGNADFDGVGAGFQDGRTAALITAAPVVVVNGGGETLKNSATAFPATLVPGQHVVDLSTVVRPPGAIVSTAGAKPYDLPKQKAYNWTVPLELHLGASGSVLASIGSTLRARVILNYEIDEGTASFPDPQSYTKTLDLEIAPAPSGGSVNAIGEVEVPAGTNFSRLGLFVRGGSTDVPGLIAGDISLSVIARPPHGYLKSGEATPAQITYRDSENGEYKSVEAGDNFLRYAGEVVVTPEDDPILNVNEAWKSQTQNCRKLFKKAFKGLIEKAKKKDILQPLIDSFKSIQPLIVDEVTLRDVGDMHKWMKKGGPFSALTPTKKKQLFERFQKAMKETAVAMVHDSTSNEVTRKIVGGALGA